MRGLTSSIVRSRTVAVAMALSAAAMVAVPASAGTRPAPPSKWRLYDVPVKGRANLDGVTATARDDAWAAGFYVSPGLDSAHQATTAPKDECIERSLFPSLMLHWDGHRWQQVPMPKMGRINYVSASGRNDVWASADCGLMHWDGRHWATVPFAPIRGAQQFGTGAIKTVGPNDAWLAGYTYDNRTGVTRGITERWDGKQWRVVPLPDLGDDFSLDSIDARGPHDVWTVGTDYTGNNTHAEHLLLLHWNGRTWNRLPAPATGDRTNRVNRVRELTGDNVWVSGWGKRTAAASEIRRPLILHWNGHKWAVTKVPDGPGELLDIAASGDRLLAVGDTFAPASPSYAMYALRWTGGHWTSDSIPTPGEASLNALAPIPGGGIWTVGAVGDDGHLRPVIAHQGQ